MAWQGEGRGGERQSFWGSWPELRLQQELMEGRDCSVLP